MTLIAKVQPAATDIATDIYQRDHECVCHSS